MEGSIDYPPLVIQTSAARSLALMIGCAIAAALAAWLLTMGPSDSTRALGALVGFGIAVLYFAWKLVSPDLLTLTPEGIVWQSRWRTTKWSWRDVSRFRPVRVRLASEAVAFDLADGVSAADSYTNYYVSYAGADASIGVGWEMGAAKLADLLNKARDRWGARS